MMPKQKKRRPLITLLAGLVLVTAIILAGLHIDAVHAQAKANAALAAASRPIPVPGECVTNDPGKKLVVVSVSQQHMWSCLGKGLVEQSAVTTGATNVPNNVDDATPVGTWHIYEKFQDLPLKGCDANGCWNDYVQYWIPFDTAVGFHDASWQTFPFGSSKYKTQGSHGCVQLPTSTAAWLYTWAPVGTTVVVKA